MVTAWDDGDICPPGVKAHEFPQSRYLNSLAHLMIADEPM